jgi:hypothetical protein
MADNSQYTVSDIQTKISTTSEEPVVAEAVNAPTVVTKEYLLRLFAEKVPVVYISTLTWVLLGKELAKEKETDGGPDVFESEQRGVEDITGEVAELVEDEEEEVTGRVTWIVATLTIEWVPL